MSLMPVSLVLILAISCSEFAWSYHTEHSFSQCEFLSLDFFSFLISFSCIWTLCPHIVSTTGSIHLLLCSINLNNHLDLMSPTLDASVLVTIRQNHSALALRWLRRFVFMVTVGAIQLMLWRGHSLAKFSHKSRSKRVWLKHMVERTWHEVEYANENESILIFWALNLHFYKTQLVSLTK